MSIDKDKIKHVSKLARISIDEKKIDDLTKDLSSIFKFIEQLNELNTDKVEPLSSILNEPLRSRKDEINDGKIRDKILKNLSSLLHIPISSIGLKATTSEKLGIIGENKAIAVQSLVNLKEKI